MDPLMTCCISKRSLFESLRCFCDSLWSSCDWSDFLFLAEGKLVRIGTDEYANYFLFFPLTFPSLLFKCQEMAIFARRQSKSLSFIQTNKKQKKPKFELHWYSKRTTCPGCNLTSPNITWDRLHATRNIFQAGLSLTDMNVDSNIEELSRHSLGLVSRLDLFNCNILCKIALCVATAIISFRQNKNNEFNSRRKASLKF